jgi:hypothetical protein
MGEGRDGGGKTGRDGDDGGNEHGGAELVDAAHRSSGGLAAVSGDVGDPVAEGDVEHEPGAVGEGEDEPEGLAGQSHGGEREDPADGQGEGQEVSPRPRSRRGQHDRAEELDSADRRQWQPVDGQVEQRIHGGQDDAKLNQDQALGNREGAQEPPGAAPEREDRGRGGDAQPGDAEHADVREQQYRERGTQVMEDGAGEEI